MQKHYYHLVTSSPWPLLGGASSLAVTAGGAMYMHSYADGKYLFFLGLLGLISILSLWWRDVTREAFMEGNHTLRVQTGLKIGMVLFIVSEIMFFFAFFWAYFHSSLAAAIEIGALWPPHAIIPFHPWGVPLVNTLILLLSGATITFTHYYLVNATFKGTYHGFMYTILAAGSFLSLQYFEYKHASFSISSSIYGSTFYMLTGFHGFHVFIGTVFITVCFLRFQRGHFTSDHHVGFEAAAWYWHFVDVVWLFLFIAVYYWARIH